MKTKQQEKLDELAEFLQHYLSEDDFKKAMSIVKEMLGCLKSDVMDYIEELMLNELGEGEKKLFSGLVGEK